MVYIRRQYFAKRFARLVIPSNSHMAVLNPTKSERGRDGWRHKMAQVLSLRSTTSAIQEDVNSADPVRNSTVTRGKIRRMNDRPQLIDPSGGISHHASTPIDSRSPVFSEELEKCNQSDTDIIMELQPSSPQRERPRSATVEFGQLAIPHRNVNAESVQFNRLGRDLLTSDIRGKWYH